MFGDSCKWGDFEGMLSRVNKEAESRINKACLVLGLFYCQIVFSTQFITAPFSHQGGKRPRKHSVCIHHIWCFACSPFFFVQAVPLVWLARTQHTRWIAQKNVDCVSLPLCCAACLFFCSIILLLALTILPAQHVYY